MTIRPIRRMKQSRPRTSMTRGSSLHASTAPYIHHRCWSSWLSFFVHREIRRRWTEWHIARSIHLHGGGAIRRYTKDWNVSVVERRRYNQGGKVMHILRNEDFWSWRVGWGTDGEQGSEHYEMWTENQLLWWELSCVGSSGTIFWVHSIALWSHLSPYNYTRLLFVSVLNCHDDYISEQKHTAFGCVRHDRRDNETVIIVIQVTFAGSYDFNRAMF